MMLESSAMPLTFALGAYLAGMAGALIFQRAERVANALGFGLAALGSACGAVFGVSSLVAGRAVAFAPAVLGFGPVPGMRLVVEADALSCFFVLIASLVGLAISVYSLGYARAYYGRKNVGLLAALFNGLLLATILIFVAGNLWMFLIAWELSALLAYALVSFEHEDREARQAGVFYFIMAHLDAACILLGFLVLAGAGGDFSFEGLRGIGASLPPGQRDAAFVLFVVGFGIKAGVAPLHVWLPVAHPVAPSNVSALMSGVLIKAGIYGLVRVCFEFLGPPPMWWGVLLLAAGTVSAVLGVLYALMEHDLKRLLAYHSIENIGIILMGLGAALMFLHTGHPVLAALALIAGLYHTLNHASFKALLFLGAGAVLHAAHTRNMEELGGLARRMRWTAVFFLIGAAAISALPPLNGFVSEWLTYQSLLQGFGTTPRLVRLMFPLGGAMLALTGALAAACFVKAFGITFLGQPRSEHARQAGEVSFPMLLGQGILTAACVFLGLFPTVVLRAFDPLTQQLVGQSLAGQLTRAGGWALSGGAAQGGTVSTLGMALMALCLLPVPLVLWAVFGRGARTRLSPTWDCGLRGLTPQMQYTATGFSKPLRMIFKALFRPRREVQREYDFSPYFATTLRFESRMEEVFQRRIYRPANLGLLRVSRRVQALQAGSLRAYLVYIFVTLVALLVFAL
jgi:hydrogenase-4 component B